MCGAISVGFPSGYITFDAWLNPKRAEPLACRPLCGVHKFFRSLGAFVQHARAGPGARSPKAV